MRKYLFAAAAAATLLQSVNAAAATNVAQLANVSAIVSEGVVGVLREGSPWGPGSSPSSLLAPVDGTPPAEGTQWNNGSYWWDADLRVNQGPVTWTLALNKQYAINQLLVQADHNDTYLVEYWNGSAWVPIFNVGLVDDPGLRTRDSGVFGTILTQQFRFSATGGDNYYSLGQFQAFGVVPEPASWAMLIAGFGLVGAMSRRRRFAVSA
jgi:hypothetical protein